jgi:transcriptional regulator with XRE-family HTH domain
VDNEAIRRTHGDRLRAARIDRGWSLSGLADAIKATGTSITPQAISQWENGAATPQPAMQAIVASVLDRPWSELFSPEVA